MTINKVHKQRRDRASPAGSDASSQSDLTQKKPRFVRQVDPGRPVRALLRFRRCLTCLLFCHKTTVYRNVGNCELSLGAMEEDTAGFHAKWWMLSGIQYWTTINPYEFSSLKSMNLNRSASSPLNTDESRRSIPIAENRRSASRRCSFASLKPVVRNFLSSPVSSSIR